jgi:hypothetical protein
MDLETRETTELVAVQVGETFPLLEEAVSIIFDCRVGKLPVEPVTIK